MYLNYIIIMYIYEIIYNHRVYYEFFLTIEAETGKPLIGGSYMILERKQPLHVESKKVR